MCVCLSRHESLAQRYKTKVRRQTTARRTKLQIKLDRQIHLFSVCFWVPLLSSLNIDVDIENGVVKLSLSSVQSRGQSAELCNKLIINYIICTEMII